jgi:Raf kinase inhibitor-like YbhB/YbcL family protein
MRAALAAGLGLAAAGCGGLSGPNPISPPRVRIAVSSPAFAPGGAIPSQFTCQGRDVSLPLRFAGVPRATRAFDLVMRDLDAAGGHFIHWQLTGIPASTRSLAVGQVPAGAQVGKNSFGTLGYRGPCPPRGRAHHYEITVIARTGAAIQGVGTLRGSYARR